ncbi:MAG: YegS/Rv2252/BmrU family lipid kinase [Oscillospiraceae bacterium]|nr:YegS/Rv2252/BmrU family lipid kinase [Oscillospiraceae bacterium]
MPKKLLLIINPVSGMRLGALYTQKIVSVFGEAGYDVFTMFTTKRGDAKNWAAEYGKNFDIIVACGGDGTFNETVAGNLAGANLPLGYIPCGSTNDFAASIGLSGDIVTAAQNIADGTEHSFDAGTFGERPFTYVASFGAFTRVSYTTSQSFKNIIGHLAYIVEGGLDLKNLKPEKVSISANGDIYEGEYIFGAVSNSTSLGGVLTLAPELVNMNDGLFECMLIKHPKSVTELNRIIKAITSKQYSDCDMMEFFSCEKLSVLKNPSGGWSLDGESEPGTDGVLIKNLRSAINLVF